MTSDHILTFAAYPINERQTLVRTTWLVADDAVEGVDYDIEALTHTWKQTNVQDAAFVALCQLGAASPAYEQGPYMKSEYQVEMFIDWYTQRMQEHFA
jgi:Rieske 2Fe-2S family protein